MIPLKLIENPHFVDAGYWFKKDGVWLMMTKETYDALSKVERYILQNATELTYSTIFFEKHFFCRSDEWEDVVRLLEFAKDEPYHAAWSAYLQFSPDGAEAEAAFNDLLVGMGALQQPNYLGPAFRQDGAHGPAEPHGPHNHAPIVGPEGSDA